MDPRDSSPTCRLPSNNNPLHCTLQQEFPKFQSDEFYEALEPAFHPTSNTLQRKKLTLGNTVNPHRRLRQPQVFWGLLPLSGGTAPRARVGSSGAVLPCLWVQVPGVLPKGQHPKHSLPCSLTCIRAASSPTQVSQESANKTGLHTGTSEVSSNALIFSLRCCQPYNPAEIRQLALSAGHGESDALGVTLLARQRIVTISIGEPNTGLFRAAYNQKFKTAK